MSDINLPGPSGMSDDLNLPGSSGSAIEASGGHLMTSPEEQPALNLEQVDSPEISETVQKKLKQLQKEKAIKESVVERAKGRGKEKVRNQKWYVKLGTLVKSAVKQKKKEMNGFPVISVYPGTTGHVQVLKMIMNGINMQQRMVNMHVPYISRKL